MCSNTSHSSSGGGGCGGDNGGYGVDSIYSKKPKRQRVPKRGPGVAELEKILREQEKKNDIDKAKSTEGFSLVPSLPNSYHHHQSPSLVLASSNSLPKPLSFLPNNNNNNNNPKQFSPPTTTFYNSKNNTAVQIGGSNVVLPEHTLLPTTWNSSSSSDTNVDVGGSKSAPGFPFTAHLSNGSNTDHHQLFPSPSLMQRNQNIPSSAKNFFPLPVVSSSPTPSSSVPNCHGREPPSNQTTYDQCTYLWPEEDKMVIGAKRSRPFSLEIPPVPPFRYQVPTFSPQTQMSRIDSSFSCGTQSMLSFEPSDAISRKCNTDNGSVSDGNFLLFGCPTTPPSTHTIHRERSKFNYFPLQESNSGASIHKKPFYSFLLPREQIGMMDGLNNERIETRGDGIDLNLRL